MLILVCIITFFLAACSLLYELAIAQTVSTFAVNNVVWYSLTIGTFIGSMGIGAFLSPRFFPRFSLWLRLIILELILSVVGGTSVALIYGAQLGAAGFLAQGLSIVGSSVFFAVAFVIAAAVGILTGAELPLLIDLAGEASLGRDRSARVLGMDYMGSLLGALLFPLLFVPRTDMLAVSWLVALVNLAAVGVLVFRGTGIDRKLALAGLAAVGSVFILLLVNAEGIQQYFLSRYYYDAYPAGELRLPVRRVLTPYQSIDIVQFGAERDSWLPEVLAAYSRKFQRDFAAPRGFGLYLNNDFQFYADVEEIYHETFVHVPIAIAGHVPKRVLIMGGGDGLLLRELVKYPEIESIVQVEIDPGIVDLFRSDPVLRLLTRGAYEDKRVKLIFDDAYHFIRSSGKRFDAVFLDFPAPLDYGLSKLYSREFYDRVRQQLELGGFVVADMPGSMDKMTESGRTIWHVLSNTLRQAGFADVRPFMSRLEGDNAQALAAIQKNFVDEGEDIPEAVKEAVAREELGGFRDSLIAGFIFARPVAGEDALLTWKIPVETDVLNSERVRLAGGPHFEFKEEVDPAAVNSIFRPKLPDFSDWWDVRVSY